MKASVCGLSSSCTRECDVVSLGPGDNIKESLRLYARSLTFVKLDIDGNGAGRRRPVFSLEVLPRVIYPEPCMWKSWR
jgi:hypothetical protein